MHCKCYERKPLVPIAQEICTAGAASLPKNAGFTTMAARHTLLQYRLGAFCNWGCVAAGLTWGLGGWSGVMFSLRMGIGGRNLVGGGLRNEFFSHR